MHPIQILIHSRLQIPAKRTPQRRRHMKNGHPLRQLRLRIPTPQHIQQARKKRALKEPHEKPEHIQLRRIPQPSLGEGEGAPGDLHGGEPVGRADALDDEGRGDLHDGVGAGVGGAGVRVLVAPHAQVLLHARHVRVGQVALVEVLEEEA